MNKLFYDMKMQAVPDEKVVSQLTERLASKKTKRHARPLTAAIAVAGAAAVLTVGVGAATDWTFTFLDNVSAGFDSAAEYNIVESAAYSNSEYDLSFELVGAAADNGILLTMIDILPPGGTVFGEDNTPVMNKDICFSASPDYSGSYGTGSNFTVLSQIPGKIRVLQQFDFTMPVENRLFEITANKYLRDTEGEFLGWEPVWYAKIKTGNAYNKKTYDLGNMEIHFKLPDEPYYAELGDCCIKASRAEIGSISMLLYGNIYGLFVPRDSVINAVMSDGSTVPMKFSTAGGSDEGDYVDGKVILMFSEVVDPAEVEAVVIDGVEIKFG